MDSQLRVSMRSYAVVEGDRYLLCSDGLSGPVSAPEIADALGRDEAPAVIADRLVELANAAGGPDNIAALILHSRRAYPRRARRQRPATAARPVQHAGRFSIRVRGPGADDLGHRGVDVSEARRARARPAQDTR